MPYAFTHGTGTELDPYQVASAADLKGVRDYPEAYFIQTANIDLSGESSWDPICNGETESPLLGEYNGNGHTISDLSINTSDDYFGLFGLGMVGKIKNLKLSGFDITAGDYVGGLIGYIDSGFTVENCCVVDSSIDGNDYVGGLIGMAGSTVNDCYSISSISGHNYLGGLIGLVGDSSSVNSCYSVGTVTGNQYYGGLIGDSGSAPATDGSYYDYTVCGIEDNGWGTPKSTIQMQTQSTYSGWNFSGVWGIDESINDGYPFFLITHELFYVTADSSTGRTFTTGANVDNITKLMLWSYDSPKNILVTIYNDSTKAIKIGESTSVVAYSVTKWLVKFNPALSLSVSTTYYMEITSSDDTAKAIYTAITTEAGSQYQGGVIVDTSNLLYLETFYNPLNSGGIKSQHCFRSSAGDIPLIAHGTDLYKLSGANYTRTTNTEAEFNAGTLTDVVVLSDVSAPATAPTINGAEGSGSFTGDYYAKVTYVDADGSESEHSAASAKLTLYGVTGINWSSIPTGDATVKQRKLYRTKSGGSIYYLVTTLDNNTDTTYSDTTADASLTVEHPGSRRVILGPGDEKKTAAIITQTTRDYTPAIGTSIGQTITMPVGERKIYSISPYLTGIGAGEIVTLTLYTDDTKATTIASATVTGAVSDGYVEFVLEDADVMPSTSYYFEIVETSGTISCGYNSSGSVYTGGQLYIDGVAQASKEMTFYVYGCQYDTGNEVSEVIDLGTAPTIATLTFSQTLNSQTIAWYARCSKDNVVWGDWQAVISSGDGIPLGRYVQIKYVMTSLDGLTTPSIQDYMLTYSTGYGTATSIKGSLSGNKVRFCNWDDRVWFCDGTKNWVYDGGFVAAPDTSPTVAASGSGTKTGTYKCKVSYVNSDSTEGLPCTEVSVVASSALQFDWSAIPVTLGYTRKLYRTKANGSIFYLVTTLNDTDTTYTDTTADASLTTAIETHTGYNVLELGSGSTKPPAATIIHIHKNYAFFVEAAVPSRVYVSTVSNPHEIPSASYFQFPSAVLGFKSFGDYLIASGDDFKWYSAGEIWDVDPDVGDWAWKVVSSTIGCISHEGMVECLDGADNEILIFPLTTGIKYLNSNLMGTDLHSVPLSRNVQPYFDQAISRNTMSGIYFDMAYYIAFNWSNPATTADNHNNAVFKLDLRNREWSGLWGLDVTGFFIANNELYMTSSTCGRVYKYSGSDDDGEAIDMIVDSSYVGDHNKRTYTKLIAFIKRGCTTDDTTILTRVDNLERTIALGSSTNWAGSGGSARDVQDEITSPQKSISGGRGYKMGWRFRDNSTNDMVLYGITVLAEPPR